MPDKKQPPTKAELLAYVRATYLLKGLDEAEAVSMKLRRR